jgi:hypothetical protein
MRNLWLLTLLVGVATAQVTPNIGLNTPTYGETNWNVLLNANFTKIDSLLSGGIAIPNLNITGYLTVGGAVTFNSIANGCLNVTSGVVGSQTCGGGGEGVTSVGLADSTGLFNITGSPVTGSGTLTIASLQSQTQNLVFASPNGSSGIPTFRALVAADLPSGLATVTSVGLVDSTGLFNITGSPVTTSGSLTIASLKSQTANYFFAAPNGSSGVPVFRGLGLADLPSIGAYTVLANLAASSALPAATAVQGTDNRLLSSGSVSGGVGSLFCTDSLGGATTTGCVTGSGTVLSGAAGNMAIYASTGTTVSGDTNLNDLSGTLTYAGSGGMVSPTFTTNGSLAGQLVLSQGPASAACTGAVCLTVGTSVTGYQVVLPGAAPTSGAGYLDCAGSASPFTCTWAAGGGGGGAVSSVANSDSTLVISPTTGAVIASLNPAHSNTFTALQTINPGAGTLVTPPSNSTLIVANSGSSRIVNEGYGSTPFFSTALVGGTQASPNAVGANVQIGGFNAFAYNGTTLNGPIGSFRCYTNQTQTGSNGGTYCDVATTPNGSTVQAEAMRFENDGGITVPSTVTGGDPGPGAINAGGLNINGVAVSIPPASTPYLITNSGSQLVAGTTLPITSGGTAAATAAAARISLFPVASEVGDLVYCATYSSGCTAWNLLPGNTAGTKVLQETSSGVPSWVVNSPCTGANAGDICYYTGSAWATLTGNASGTNFLSESSAGAPSWASGGSGANVNLSNVTATAIPVALLPGTTNTVALGSSSFYWSNLFATLGTFANGSASAPSIVFAAGTTNGLYSQSANKICMAIGGNNSSCYNTASNSIIVPANGAISFSITSNDASASAGVGINAVGSSTTEALDLNSLTLQSNQCKINSVVNMTVNATLVPFCTWTLPNSAQSWGWQCSGTYTTTTSADTLSLAYTLAHAPTTVTGNAIIYTTNTGVSTSGSITSTGTGSQIMLTSSGVSSVINLPFTISGVIEASATSGTFVLSASLTGISPSGSINPGTTCSIY